MAGAVVDVDGGVELVVDSPPAGVLVDDGCVDVVLLVLVFVFAWVSAGGLTWSPSVSVPVSVRTA